MPLRATVQIEEVRDCEAVKLADAPVCRYLQMLEGCVGLPTHSIVIKYRHQEHEYIRVLGAITSETICLRAHTIGLGADLLCRVVQANESFTITVHSL